jgi:hypothetical protein
VIAKHVFVQHDTPRVIDLVRLANTLDELIAIESGVRACEDRTGRPMVAAVQIKCAINIRLGQLARA